MAMVKEFKHVLTGKDIRIQQSTYDDVIEVLEKIPVVVDAKNSEALTVNQIALQAKCGVAKVRDVLGSPMGQMFVGQRKILRSDRGTEPRWKPSELELDYARNTSFLAIKDPPEFMTDKVDIDNWQYITKEEARRLERLSNQIAPITLQYMLNQFVKQQNSIMERKYNQLALQNVELNSLSIRVKSLEENQTLLLGHTPETV